MPTASRRRSLLRRDRALRAAAALMPLTVLIGLACRLPSPSDERAAALNPIYQRESPAWQKSLALHETKTRRLATKAARSGDQWAGRYYCGDGQAFNHRLTLTTVGENASFCYTERGCTGLYDFDFGRVFVGYPATGQTLLRLYGAVPSTLHGRATRFSGLSRRLVPVLWGTRHYLIGENQFSDFCNAVNARSESAPNDYHPYSLWFLLREGDEKKPLSALPPVVPFAYRRYLLPASVTATATAAVRLLPPRTDTDDRSWRTTEITLNRGAADGILPGMTFYGEHLPRDDEAVVDAVTGPQTCRATMKQFIGNESPDPAPQRGGHFSTRLYD